MLKDYCKITERLLWDYCIEFCVLQTSCSSWVSGLISIPTLQVLPFMGVKMGWLVKQI